MRNDVIWQLTDYGKHADLAAPAISRAEVESRALLTPMSQVVGRRRTPGWAIAAATALLVLAVVGGLTVVLGGSQDSLPPTNEGPSVASTMVTSTTVASVITSTYPPRVQGMPFDFTLHDLCEWFTGDEILAIVADAYAAEGVHYPLPDELVADTEQIRNDRPGCDWTVPGTPGGWGRPDFTVMFRDDSDFHLTMETGDEGPTLLESYHDPSPESYVQPLDEYNLAWRDVLDLVIPGVVDVRSWSPGIIVYVVSADRLINFRHDLVAGVQGDIEDFRVEYRIVNEMLERMNWLPNTDADE